MFKKLEYYKPDLEKTIRTLNKMYDDALHHRGGNVTFRALPPSDVEFYSLFDLTKYNYETDIKKYTEDLLTLLEESYSLRREIDDNMLPTISPMLGIGDYSAFIIGDIDFRSDTSWAKPSFENIDDWKKMPPLGTSKWYKKFLEICEEMLKISASSGIPFMRGFFSPLDLAGALRGDKIYYDFYDSPKELHELLDFCADATIMFAKDIYALANKYLKESKYGMYYLNGIINMSEDIACMISADTYREFCRPHTQKVIDYFGVGHLHTHSRSMYLVKEVCSLERVVNLWLPTDPNAPRPIDHLDSLIQDANGTCLAIDIEDFSEIEKNIETLKKGNFSITLPVKDIAEAKLLTEKFNRLMK
jgi:hypothetical protein